MSAGVRYRISDNGANLMNQVRPFHVASSGDYFLVMSFGTSDGKIHVFRSQDQGITWAEEDAGHVPAMRSNSLVHSVARSGEILYICYPYLETVAFPPTDFRPRIAEFNMETGMWGTVHIDSGSPVLAKINNGGFGGDKVVISFLALNAGNFLLFYNGTPSPALLGGFYPDRIYYAIWTPGAWSAVDTNVDPVGDAYTGSLWAVDVQEDAAGRLHFIYADGFSNGGGTTQAVSKTRSAIGVFSSRQVICSDLWLTGQTGRQIISNLEVSATEAWIAYGVDLGLFPGIGVASAALADSLSWAGTTVVSDSAKAPSSEGINRPKYLALALDGSTVRVLWSQSVIDGEVGYTSGHTDDSTIWMIEKSAASWGTASVLFHTDAGTAEMFSAQQVFLTNTAPKNLVVFAATDGSNYAERSYFFEIPSALFNGSLATAVTISGTFVSLQLSCNNPPGGTVGVPYNHELSASGGFEPYTFALISGALPPGLVLDTSTGEIRGTPTTVGTFPFKVRVTDSLGNTAQIVCSITIVTGAPAPLRTGCNMPPIGCIGDFYFHSISITGGTPPYTVVTISGQIPPGLSFDPNTGIISGTPTTNGLWVFGVQITDAQGNTATCICSIVTTCC